MRKTMSVIDYIFGYVYVPIKFIKITSLRNHLIFLLAFSISLIVRAQPNRINHHQASTARRSNHHHLHDAASQLPRQTFYFPPAICLTSWQLVRQSNPKMTKRNCHNANLKS